MIRIVLADDHALLREGTRHMLAQHHDLRVVGEAATGDEALALIMRHHPDVAILDMRMPGLAATEVIGRAAEIAPSTRCVILSAYDNEAFVLGALEAGAAGYLPKTVKAAELAAAVRAVYRGETVLHPDLARRVTRLWVRGSLRKDPNALTPQEMHVLRLAARGLRNKDIAQTLAVSVRTVEGHFSAILAKLALPSRTAAVVYGAAHGWFTLEGMGDTLE